MNKKGLTATLTVTLLIVLVAGVYLALGARPQLGLDLRGGISAIYTPVIPEGREVPEDFDAVLDQTIEVIRTRVDSLGVAEPDISRQGDDVMVQLPGVQDADRMREIIGTTAKLTFRPVEEVIQPGDEAYEEGPPCDLPADEREELPDDEGGIMCGEVDEETAPDVEPLKYRVGPAALTGDRIDDAFPAIDQQGGGGYIVSLDLDRPGGQAFAEITGELACDRDQGLPGLLAITLDNVVNSAPSMNPTVPCGVGITGGSASISTGGANPEEQRQEAEDLALVLQTGALPISLEPSTFETVSPTLGAESLRSGLLAGIIGLFLVAGWLIFFYRTLGVVAISALGIFGVLVMAIMSLMGQLGFALTLAGIAGLIVSIGITADSSIIFFERIRDEVNLGKTVRTSVKRAFDSAFRTNLAGNTVTLAAAIILYFLAVGPVRGFALMLGMATVLDIIILYFFTRPAVTLLSTTKLLQRRTVRASAKAPAAVGGAR